MIINKLYTMAALAAIFVSVQLNGQTTPDTTHTFPKGWLGDWHGTLDIYNAKGKTQSVPMWVEIYPIDSSTQGRLTFGLVYGSKSQDWRPYEIMPVDTARGIWRVDEKNSIQMESYVIGSKLLCWFVVQNNRILCTYERKGANQMIFEVVAGRETAVSTTGNTKQGEEDIPEVLTYPISGFQRAVLTRQ
jgi:hypothetical protein